MFACSLWQDLICKLPVPMQVDGCKDRYMTFELEGGKKIVLDAEQARRD